MVASTRSHSIQPWRYLVLYLGMLFVLVIFIARLISLQLLQGEKYLAQAEDNRTQVLSDPADKRVDL
ncbi:MAG: hypothetical protein RMJ60_09155 [Anaerolineales bacterium]|nr:hypothetical protein [Anaerolineales bacterium]